MPILMKRLKMAIYPVLFKYLNLSGGRTRIMDVNLLVVHRPSDKFLTIQIFQTLPAALRTRLGMN